MKITTTIFIHKNNRFSCSSLKNNNILTKLLIKYRTYVLSLELLYTATVLGKKLRRYLSVRHFINVKVFEFLSWYSLGLALVRGTYFHLYIFQSVETKLLTPFIQSGTPKLY